MCSPFRGRRAALGFGTEVSCVQVQAAALDEMFHHGEASVLRYHKALLLMEGLMLLLTEHGDIISISRCELAW